MSTEAPLDIKNNEKRFLIVSIGNPDPKEFIETLEHLLSADSGSELKRGKNQTQSINSSLYDPYILPSIKE